MQFIPGLCFRRIDWFWIPFTFRTTPSSILLSGLAAICKILEVGELSYFYKLSYWCVSWLVCIDVLFRISSLITHQTISSGSYWIKLTTWLKSDDGYRTMVIRRYRPSDLKSVVWFYSTESIRAKKRARKTKEYVLQKKGRKEGYWYKR